MKPLGEWTDDEIWDDLYASAEGGPDGPSAMKVEVDVLELTRRAFAAGRQTERERCARTCEKVGASVPLFSGRQTEWEICRQAADAIRSLQ